MRLISLFATLAPGALLAGRAAAAPASFNASVPAANSTLSVAPSAPTGVTAGATPDTAPDTSAQNCNTPSNRACWLPGFDVNTDWEANTPTTGHVRSVRCGVRSPSLAHADQQYTFVITEVDDYRGADGVVKKKAMLINGEFSCR